MRYSPTGEQVADILTKALGRTKFVYFREKMGMVKNPFQSLKWIGIRSCNATISSGSAMGSMMQHDERGCSADATVAVAGPWAATRMHRELLYRCSSGRAMGSSTCCSSAEDVGWQA